MTQNRDSQRNIVFPKRKICSFVTPARRLMPFSRDVTNAATRRLHSKTAWTATDCEQTDIHDHELGVHTDHGCAFRCTCRGSPPSTPHTWRTSASYRSNRSKTSTRAGSTLDRFCLDEGAREWLCWVQACDLLPAQIQGRHQVSARSQGSTCPAPAISSSTVMHAAVRVHVTNACRHCMTNL